MSPDPAAASTSGLGLHTYDWEEAIVVQCSGRLTLEHSDTLKTHVRNLLPRTKAIILDLKETSRMDSSGLGAVVALYISARKANCQFVLINYNNSIKDLLGLTSLLSTFEACARNGIRLP
jgi:anti-sigma B factor antagonist